MKNMLRILLCALLFPMTGPTNANAAAALNPCDSVIVPTPECPIALWIGPVEIGPIVNGCRIVVYQHPTTGLPYEVMEC